MRSVSSSALSLCTWLFTLVLVMGARDAEATPWRVLAPNPLASDSSYAVLSAQPSDSLTTHEISWLLIQRNWRAQRAEELRGGTSGISESWSPHHARFTDEHFAQLASLPFSALSESDLAWLVTESQAQRAQAPTPAANSGSEVMGVVLVAAVVGSLAAYLTVAWLFNGIFH